jgi:hypothetical protein
MAIECEDPLNDWRISIDQNILPFLMLGLVGIIHAPFDALNFDEVRHLNDLFEKVEDQAGLLINFADIWLPDFLFPREVHVGDMFRLEMALFNSAYRFRDGRQTEREFVSSADTLIKMIRFSETETRVFAAWSQEQLEIARKHGDKNPQLKLRTRE